VTNSSQFQTVLFSINLSSSWGSFDELGVSYSSWLLIVSLLIRNLFYTCFLDVLICNTAVVGLRGGTSHKGGARREVRGGGLVGGRGLGLTCQVMTSSSVRSIAAGADGPLVDISEEDAGAKACLVEWQKLGSMADSPLLGCTLTV
jgi:hypothetical protein